MAQRHLERGRRRVRSAPDGTVGRKFAALLQTCAIARQDADTMPAFKHVNQRDAELADVVASVLIRRLDGIHLGVVLANKTRRQESVEARVVDTVVEELVDVPRQYRLDCIFAYEPDQP